MMNKDSKVFLTAFLAEWCLLVWFRNEAGYILSPLLILTAGFVMGFYFLKINKIIKAEPKETVQLNVWWIYLAGLLLTAFYGVLLIHQNPLKIENSDVNFLINDIYVHRFVHGESVYALYTGFNYGTFTPNYLPFHWLPFCISYLAGFDERYMVLFITFISIAFYFAQLHKNASNKTELLVKGILPFALVLSIFIKQGKDFANTVELLLSSYYLFLAIALFSKGYFQKIAGLTITFLSRYLLLFWMPILAWIEWKNDAKKMMLLLAGFIVSVLIFFIIPFVIPQPQMLSGISNLYKHAALGEWQGQSWQQPGDKPFQLFQGMGFASWIYQFTSGELSAKIGWVQSLLFVFSALSTIVLLLLRIFKFKQIPAPIYALFSLKISILVFLSFVVVPYVYLFWTVLFLSLAMILFTPLASTPLQENTHKEDN